MSTTMNCNNCKYFGKHSSPAGHKEGLCRRFPETVAKLRADVCGEHLHINAPRPKPKAS